MSLSRNILIPVFFSILVSISFVRIPILDRTESRVAVISDSLVKSSNWTNLMIPKGGAFVPYYAKPPLHYWTVASSLALFGKSEWAARLPSILAGTILLLVIPLFRPVNSGSAQLILASCLLFFFSTGIALIDASLTCALGLTLLGLYRWLIQASPSRCALALLIGGASWACALKGPVGVAIPALTISLFCLYKRSLAPMRSLPLKRVLVGVCTIVGAYYCFYEVHNPGFLRYFFINENILRFLMTNYGDRTGSGHPQWYGMSIVFAFLAFLPWSPLLIRSLWSSPPRNDAERFLACALIAPVILFLFARQHLATYQIPTLLPAALLLSTRLRTVVAQRIATIACMVFVSAALVCGPGIGAFFSSQTVFDEALDIGAENIHFFPEPPLSAYWYGSSSAQFDSLAPDHVGERPFDIFVMRQKQIPQFSALASTNCHTKLKSIGKWAFFACS